MRRSALALLAALAACGPLPPPPDTAQLPPGVFGGLDQDVSAALYAQYAFSSADRTYGNPVAGAQAVLAIEYLAGEMNTSPRWANINATTQLQLLQARVAVRRAVGIAPSAPSQLVVDSLAAARADLEAGDQARAEAALTNPAFPAGGAAAVKALTSLPYVREANVASQQAAEEIFGPGEAGGQFRF